METSNVTSVPLISVVMAVYNAEKDIQKTIQSLKLQSFKSFEVVLIDGASTDRTMQIVGENIDLFSKVVSEKDDGIGDAWNKGVALSDGDWVVFLNAGDLLHPSHFDRANRKLDSEGSDGVVFCDVHKFDSFGKIVGFISGNVPSKESIVRGSLGFSHPGSFTRRTVFEQIGAFDTNYKIAIDANFLIRCYLKNISFERLESCAYMASGGISDLQFSKAMFEYYNVLLALNLVGSRQALFYRNVLPCARWIVRLARRLLGNPARFFKHLLVSCTNLTLSFVPFPSWQRFLFRCLGFSMGKKSSIGLGSNLYGFGRVSLGAGSVVNRNCLLDNRGGIQIGSNVSISRGVSIFTAGHDIDSPFFEMKLAQVEIGDYSVIFSGVTIMPGVKLGRGCVVYGGAVVTKDVPPMAIVAGVPAKEIGKRKSVLLYTLDYQFPMAM